MQAHILSLYLLSVPRVVSKGKLFLTCDILSYATHLDGHMPI